MGNSVWILIALLLGILYLLLTGKFAKVWAAIK